MYAIYDNPHTYAVECWEDGKLRKFVSFMAIACDPQFKNWGPPRPGRYYGDREAIREDMRPPTDQINII